MSKKWVKVAIVVIFVAIVGWDVWLYTDDIPRNAISQIVIDLTAKTPYVPYGIGFFFGWLTAHFFG